MDLLSSRRLRNSYFSVTLKNMHQLHFSRKKVQLHFSVRNVQLAAVAQPLLKSQCEVKENTTTKTWGSCDAKKRLGVHVEGGATE
jgi:hypothetical protein